VLYSKWVLKKKRGQMPVKNLLSAKDISKKFKVPYPTINHYTDLGFLSIVKREGNKRLYSEQEVRTRLTKISKMMNEGYPLRLIHKKIVSRQGRLA
jgi:DNA-binding transcriptional MerR regulator